MESRKKNALNRLGSEEECGRSESGKARLSRDPASMQCGPPPEGQGYTDVLKSQRMACLKKSVRNGRLMGQTQTSWKAATATA